MLSACNHQDQPVSQLVEQRILQFGTIIDDQRDVRVHDSTADMRYLVLPLRPAGTEGLSERQLADLIGRDSLIGLVEVRA